MVEKTCVVQLMVAVRVFFHYLVKVLIRYCCTSVCHVVCIPVVTAISGRSCNRGTLLVFGPPNPSTTAIPTLLHTLIYYIQRLYCPKHSSTLNTTHLCNNTIDC